MFVSRRLRLALLVSLGPPTTGTPDLDAPADAPGTGTTPGAPFLASGALLAPAPSWAAVAPLAFPSVLVAVAPPLPQPASNKADSAPRAIRLLACVYVAGTVRRGDSRWVNARCMTDLRGTSAGRTVCPLERRRGMFVPYPAVSI